MFPKGYWAAPYWGSGFYGGGSAPSPGPSAGGAPTARCRASVVCYSLPFGRTLPPPSPVGVDEQDREHLAGLYSCLAAHPVLRVPRVIDLNGAVETTIDLRGSVETLVDLEGAVETVIDLAGAL